MAKSNGEKGKARWYRVCDAAGRRTFGFIPVEKVRRSVRRLEHFDSLKSAIKQLTALRDEMEKKGLYVKDVCVNVEATRHETESESVSRAKAEKAYKEQKAKERARREARLRKQYEKLQARFEKVKRERASRKGKRVSAKRTTKKVAKK